MKNFGFSLIFLFLVACSSNDHDPVKEIENEYAILDCDILRTEQELLSKMIAEEERSLTKSNVVGLAVGLLAFATTGSGSFSGADNKKLDEYRLRLKALNNLVERCSE